MFQLYRVLVDAYGRNDEVYSYDVIVLAEDDPRAVALAQQDIEERTGLRAAALAGGTVPVVPDHARVVAVEAV